MSAEKPERYFQDSWRPEDKAMEAAEERQLLSRFPAEIARQRAERHAHSPPLRGFEDVPRVNEVSDEEEVRPEGEAEGERLKG